MTDHEKTQASLRFLEASKGVQDEADNLADHRNRLVQRIMNANVDRARLYSLMVDQLGAQAFTVEALELAAELAAELEKMAGDD